MTEAMLAATLSTTTPLSLLEQYYGSVEKSVTSYWRSCPKAGGNAMSADIATTILHSTIPVDDRIGERDFIMVQRSPFIPVFEANTNSSFKINGPLPSKGDQYIAVVFVGYGSIMNQLSKALPGIMISRLTS